MTNPLNVTIIGCSLEANISRMNQTNIVSEGLPKSKSLNLDFDQRNVGIFLSVLKKLNLKRSILNECFKSTVFLNALFIIRQPPPGF